MLKALKAKDKEKNLKAMKKDITCRGTKIKIMASFLSETV